MIGSIPAASRPSADTVRKVQLAEEWLQEIQTAMLRTGRWGMREIEAWNRKVEQIVKGWWDELHEHSFPKLHMLYHMSTFVSEHRYLGSVSEAQIESYHAQFNNLWNFHYHRYVNDPPDRFARCLREMLVKVLQPIAINDDKENDNPNSTAAAERRLRPSTI